METLRDLRNRVCMGYCVADIQKQINYSNVVLATMVSKGFGMAKNI